MLRYLWVILSLSDFAVNFISTQQSNSVHHLVCAKNIKTGSALQKK